MKMSGMSVVLIVILIVFILFLVGGCTLSCKSMFKRGNTVREGYKRSCLAGDCYGLQRTPVDYALKYPNGWQRNPHYITDPHNKYQPLDYGPVDLDAEGRRLAANNGILFQQYRNDWKGCGKQLVSLTNDEKNRFDLTNIGDHGARTVLDNMYSRRFGPKGQTFTAKNLAEVNPFFNKMYGGPAWLRNDKLGD